MAEHLQDVLKEEARQLKRIEDAKVTELGEQFKLTCAEHGIGPDAQLGTGVILNENQDDLRHFVARAAACGDGEARAFRSWFIENNLWASSYVNNQGLSPEMEYWKIKRECADT